MSSAPSDAAGRAPWADLLPEVCDHVLDRLDAVGVIRFPAACAAWAAASKMSSTPRLRPGSPTLLTCGLDPDGDDIEYNVEAGTFGLHDVATGKSYYGEAQGLENRTWIGGKDDWLVTTDLQCGAELLNPITGDRVPLPPFTAIRGLDVQVMTKCDLHVAVENSVHLFQQVTLCRTPAHPDGFLAVAHLFSNDSLGLLAFTAAGDEGWTPLKNPDEGLHYRNYTDATVHNGKVVAVTQRGDICSWDMDAATGAEAGPTRLPGPEIHIGDELMRGFYLAASSGGGQGQLQVACMSGHGGDKDSRSGRIVFKSQWSFCPCRVTLHELDAGNGTWRRIRDLSADRALFAALGGGHQGRRPGPC